MYIKTWFKVNSYDSVEFLWRYQVAQHNRRESPETDEALDIGYMTEVTFQTNGQRMDDSVKSAGAID